MKMLKLRQRCMEKDISSADLERATQRSRAHISAVLNARSVPDAADIYAIGTLLEIPAGEWGEVFFPPEVVRLIARKLEERS